MRIATLDALHPAALERVNDLLALLDRERVYGLQVYETARSPWRQAQLWARGRVTPGKTATKAPAWRSMHQFGLAVDMVFYVDGSWSWNEPEAGMWERYHACARASGLVPLSFERPHVELAWNEHALWRGELPPGYEGSQFHRLIDEWSERWGPVKRHESGDWHPGAPPIPDIAARPELVG